MESAKKTNLASLYSGTTSEEDDSLLVTIIDANVYGWMRWVSSAVKVEEKEKEKDKEDGEKEKDKNEINGVLDQMLVFFNAFLSLRYNNSLAIIASNSVSCEFLHPVAKDAGDVTAIDLQGKYEPFKVVERNSLKGLKRMMVQSLEKGKNATTSDKSAKISGALSMALCYINKSLKAPRSVKPRILVFTASPDSRFQYISIMNSIFTAQKVAIPIDVCCLAKEDSVFLQQAAFFTDGIYQKIEQPEGFLQYLLSLFIADRHSRKWLHLPTPENVDFRAACFCHKNVIDIGYVCSVCLSIYCNNRGPVCSTCKTAFSLQRTALRKENGTR